MDLVIIKPLDLARHSQAFGVWQMIRPLTLPKGGGETAIFHSQQSRRLVKFRLTNGYTNTLFTLIEKHGRYLAVEVQREAISLAGLWEGAYVALSQPLQWLGKLLSAAVSHGKLLAAWQSHLYKDPAVLRSSHRPFLSFVEPMHYSTALFHYQKLPVV